MKGESTACPECGSEFIRKTKNMRFCSVKCRGRFNMREHRKRNPEKSKLEMRERRARERGEPYVDARETVRTCPHCGEEFSPTSVHHPWQKYCSKQCRAAAESKRSYQRHREAKLDYAREYRERVAKPKRRAQAAFKHVFREPKKCDHCGREFKPDSPKHWWKQRFCGRKECKRVGLLQAQKRYYRANQEERRKTAAAGRVNRRAIEKGVGGLISAATYDRVYARDNSTCVYCNRKVHPKSEPGDLRLSREADHLIPLSSASDHSGAILNRSGNLVTSCHECNHSKSAKSISSWLEDPITKARGITGESINPTVWRLLEQIEKQLTLE